MSDPKASETTFRSFTPGQSANYAQYRRDYHPILYQSILDHHRSTGGQFDVLVDVGCGPGLATRNLAPHFSRLAVGVDASAGMIEAARAVQDGSGIRFVVSSVEEMRGKLSAAEETGGVGLIDGGVDLITSANAAHWFDMAGFWDQAGRLLRPGGSVALWASGHVVVHPDMAGAKGIQEALDKAWEVLEGGGYVAEGNRLAKGLYKDLPLPWTVGGEVEGAGVFEKEGLYRKEWNGINDEVPFHVENQLVNLKIFERVWGTTSPVVRWREAHPDEAGTEKDVVKIMMRGIGDALREAGVEDPATLLLKGGVGGVLLIVKKKKEGLGAS